MLQFPPGSALGPPIGVTVSARIVVAVLGALLLAWTIAQLRRRILLVPLATLFTGVSFLLAAFALVPSLFNRIAWLAGVQYPPVFYLMGAVVVLMLVTLRLAIRLSTVDMRCRRLAQELAIHRAETIGIDRQ